MEALLKRIEAYGFECEAGLLSNCEDWQRLRNNVAELERQNAELRHQLVASADKTAATVQPNLSAPNGITATLMHDAGAIAQCGYCRRYTLDQKALFDERYQPICDCGKKHGWTGSFTAPTPESKWHGAAPHPQAAQSEDAQKVWLVLDEQGYPNHCASWPEACHEHINDAIIDHDIEEAARWTVRSATLDPRPIDAALAQAGKGKR